MIVGTVESTTVMAWVQVLLLPQASVAVQTREIAAPDAQSPAFEIFVKVTDGSGSQLSVAVAVPVSVGSVTPSHSTVASAGQVISGGVVSTTVTVWVQLDALPHSSVAVQTREITSSWGQVPAAELSLSETDGSPSQLSVAVATPVAEEVLSPSHSTVASAGQVISGGVESTTVTV